MVAVSATDRPRLARHVRLSFSETRQQQADARRLEMEAKIAGLKSIGVQRAEEEWDIRKRFLQAEENFTENKDPNRQASIRTEISTKYDRASVSALFDAAGLRIEAWPIDPATPFGLVVGAPA